MTRTVFLTTDNIFAIGDWLNKYCRKLRDIYDPDDKRKVYPEFVTDDGYDFSDPYIEANIFDTVHYSNMHRVRIPAGARIEGLDVSIVKGSEISPDFCVIDTTPEEDWILLTPPTSGEEIHIRWDEGMFELIIDSEKISFYTEDPIHKHTYSSVFYRFRED